MPRFEFSRKDRREIHLRANGHCEGCGAMLKPGEGEYDHRIAQGYGGENVVENGQLLCRVCHKAKTARDKAITEKTKRRRDKHTGVYVKHSHPLPGTKASGVRKKMNGTIERREDG